VLGDPLAHRAAHVVFGLAQFGHDVGFLVRGGPHDLAFDVRGRFRSTAIATDTAFLQCSGAEGGHPPQVLPALHRHDDGVAGTQWLWAWPVKELFAIALETDFDELFGLNAQ
jgi:hypothetical protein